jgi:hypothetical protein
MPVGTPFPVKRCPACHFWLVDQTQNSVVRSWAKLFSLLLPFLLILFGTVCLVTRTPFLLVASSVLRVECTRRIPQRTPPFQQRQTWRKCCCRCYCLLTVHCCHYRCHCRDCYPQLQIFWWVLRSFFKITTGCLQSFVVVFERVETSIGLEMTEP